MVWALIGEWPVPLVDEGVFCMRQESLSGCSTFSGRAGRVGATQFSQGVGAAGTEWEQLSVEEEALREAAEVVIGRADLQDLTGLGVPSSKAEQVRVPSPNALPDWSVCCPPVYLAAQEHALPGCTSAVAVIPCSVAIRSFAPSQAVGPYGYRP
jgi:hypothetical protein